MLDPASSVEMVKVLEEDPMVGGVGGDVQVRVNTTPTSLCHFSKNHITERTAQNTILHTRCHHAEDLGLVSATADTSSNNEPHEMVLL